MPIVAIEGPDKCGKSTLFDALRAYGFDAAYVRLPPYGAQRMAFAGELALRDLEIWEALYEPGRLYVSDRHVLVSGVVYGALYRRPLLRASRLRVSALYLEVPVEELQRRHLACGEDIQAPHLYPVVKRLYNEVLATVPHRVMTANNSVEDAATFIQELAYGRSS